MSIFLRWGIPALLTVVGGTAAALATTGASIPAELSARTSNALVSGADDWALVSFDGRDATVGGTAATQEVVDAAVARVAAVHGVRSVRSAAVLAEAVSPYPFVATVDGGSTTISGGMPDEAARAIVVADAGEGITDLTRPMAGSPARGPWLEATRYALELTRRMDEGEVALADLEFTISGRARSQEAFEELTGLLKSGAPDGTTVAYNEVLPPLLAPYEWRAEFDGSRVSMSGAVPSDMVADDISATLPAGTDLAKSLVLASGEPAGFALTARSLVENLVKLERGSATISDTTSTLAGTPGSPEVVESVLTAMAPGDAVVQLEAPAIDDYWFSAERAGGDIVLDGFVPDQAFLDRVAAISGIDASSLELGRGAPERFGSAVDFVLEVLSQMSEGTAEIKGSVVTIDGRAATIADYDAINMRLTSGAPQGILLANATVKPPVATPFTFAAARREDGTYAISGHVPSGQARERFAAALPVAPADTTTVADGYPADFEVAAVKALKILPLLDSGEIAYDGANWSLTGVVDTPQEAFAAESAFADAGLRAAGWTYEVTLPPQAVAAVPPTIAPYAWSASKSRDGTVAFTGYVPTEQLKRYLAAHAGAGAEDGTQLGEGAPDGFIAGAVAGLDALMAMRDGALTLSGTDWSLTGAVEATSERQQVEAALRAAADTAGWHIAIQADDAAPVVVPFTWSAAKTADGRMTLSGYVPTEGLRKALSTAAGSTAVDRTLVGSGEPAAFEQAATAAVAALARLESGEAKLEGGAWSLSGQPASVADADAVRALLGDGTWTLALAEPLAAAPAPEGTAPLEAPASEAATPADAAPPADFVFEATKLLGGPVDFSGIVPAEPMRRYLAVVTGGEPSERLAIGDGLPTTFIPSAEAGSRALALLADGRFGLADDVWRFSGRAETEGQRQAALAELARAPGMDSWQTEITLLPPLEVCKDKVGAFAARNAILFESGSARIAAASQPAIDELSGYLAVCPEASVEVEGHTDSDGEEEANLALSVARAEAVVDALILRGVGPERLYAIGYGESLPVADNDTRAGKQANRRIAFSVSAP